MPGTGVIRIATPDGQVKEYSVDFDSAIVGRADGNRIVIPHVSVSRRHAHLTFADGQLMVEDFASATGTFVDGHQLLAGERLPIRPGADVRFGEARAIWVVPDVAPPPPPLASEPSQPAAVQPPVASGPIVSNPDFVVSTPPPVYVPRPSTPAPAPFPSAAAPVPFQAPAEGSASAAMAAQTEAVQRQYIGVTLSSPPTAVAPGTATAATVIVQNRGSVVDEFTISVVDVPSDWIQIARPRLSLLPGARDELTVVIRPPEGPIATAGGHRFTVVVASKEHAIDVRAIGEFTIQSVERLEATMRPMRGKGSYTVEVRNSGNVVVPLVIEGSDDEELLNYRIPTQTMLQPGETKTVQVNVKPKKSKKFGKESTTAFHFNVRSGQSSAAPIRLDGSNSYRPPFERWKLPVVGLLLLGGIGSGTYGAVSLCTRDLGFCPDLIRTIKGEADKKPVPTVPGIATKTETPKPVTTGPSTAASVVPPTTGPAAVCPSTRLKAGQDAVLINSEPSKTFVRSEPSRASASIGQEGDNFRVKLIRCQKASNGEDLIFWEVTLSVPVGGKSTGWIAEQDPATKVFLLSPVP